MKPQRMSHEKETQMGIKLVQIVMRDQCEADLSEAGFWASTFKTEAEILEAIKTYTGKNVGTKFFAKNALMN